MAVSKNTVKMQDDQHNNDVGAVPWKIREQRPSNVSGFKDVNLFCELDDGQTSCRENQLCFYFHCRKCSPLLALDTFNTLHKTQMEYIPAIANIKRPSVFEEEEEFKYHGEVFQMYLNYFAQIPKLKGVAINGWSNRAAERIFDSVSETFGTSRGYQETLDFEIDWLMFSGTTITVIEVKEKSGKGNSTKNFDKKMDQIAKNRIVMRHLLQAADCNDVKINYVIACPNVSITEVLEGDFFEEHEETVEAISRDDHRLGFISEECMCNGIVYMYESESVQLLTQNEFCSVIEGTETMGTLGTGWSNKYRYVTSLVVLSMLLVDPFRTCVGRDQHPLTGFTLPQLKQKKKRFNILTEEVFRTKTAADKFPEELVLGPKQLEIVESDDDRILIRGEAGCGKTLVLLAILYRYTSKYLSNSRNADYRKVMFAIPKQKTEFLKYLKNFVHEHCDINHVVLQPIEPNAKRLVAENDVQVILVDEFVYTDIGFLASFFKEIPSDVKVCVASLLCRASLLKSRSKNEKPLEYLKKCWTSFYLQNSYRCPVNIEIRCAKIRRSIHQETKILSEPFPISPLSICLEHGVNVVHEDSIKVLKYHKNFKSLCQLPKKQSNGETMLAVLYGFQTDDFDVLEDYTSVVKITYGKFFDQSEDFLTFTGVQYHTVTFIVSPLKLFSDGKNKIGLREINIELCLYQTLSRALSRVFVICHKDNFEYFTNLLSLDKLDLQVMEKLRRKQTLNSKDVALLTTGEDKREALKILLLTKNWDQFTKMKHIFEEKNLRLGMETTFYQHCFVNRHQTEFLEMLLRVVQEIGVPEKLDFVKVYCFIAENMQYLDNVYDHREVLLPLLKETFHKYTSSTNAIFKISDYLEFQTATVCWSDRKLFGANLTKTRRIMTSIIKDFCQLCQTVPCSLTRIYHVANWKAKNFMNRKDADKLFQKCSKIQKVPRSRRSQRRALKFNDIKMECIKFCNPFQIDLWECYMDGGNLPKYFELAFETFLYYNEDSVYFEGKAGSEITECCHKLNITERKLLCKLVHSVEKLVKQTMGKKSTTLHNFLNSFKQMKGILGKLE